jgi:hypothetical protein
VFCAIGDSASHDCPPACDIAKDTPALSLVHATKKTICPDVMLAGGVTAGVALVFVPGGDAGRDAEL